MNNANGSEFYVGYLPTPKRLIGFLKLAVPLAIGVTIGASLILARTQTDPGPAVWDDTESHSFSGVVSGGPYPVLYAADRGDGKPGPMLLVSSGKHGCAARLASVAGKSVTLRGTLLRRGEGRMIELDDGDDAVREAGDGKLPAIVSIGRVVLRGEIVDSKCYLGAMKPGHGRPHKECATLCIRGGIPPTLLYTASDGTTGSCLLLDASGGALDESAHAFIADPVEVSGELEEQGGVRWLRVRPTDIVRL